MGKPVSQGKAEIEKCAVCCEFYAEFGEGFLADEQLSIENARIRYVPTGTLLAVMPWNFPFWQVFRAICPVLMSGNTMVLKHASNVMGCATEIERCLTRAAMPINVFRTLKITSLQVPHVIQSPGVSAVTLTGSESAGRAVASEAGANLKPCVLELGGSDPFIVLESADLDEAAKFGAVARCQNAGQSCIAAKRFIVAERVHDAFVAKLHDQMKALKVDDPMLETTDVGPLAQKAFRDELHGQVLQSVSEGAELALGGVVPESEGAFYPPTVLLGVKRGMSAFEEETFGPVAAIVQVADAAEAIEMANATRFGLGASIWTRDVQMAEAITLRLESGIVFVNQMVRSDPRLPFGGIKSSGFGRELWTHGIHAFVNSKLICSAQTERPKSVMALRDDAV